MSGPIAMKELLECGVHFGHQTRKWNPKMKPYIFGARNGIHIINLQQTVKLFRQAYQFVMERAAEGETVLFVGTKHQAADVVREEAERSGMFYVNNRWLGGTLTNFRTIKVSVENLNELDKMYQEGNYPVRTKKEAMMKDKLRLKLAKNLSGIRKMNRLPGIMFVIDPQKEDIAIAEANKLGIPVVAVCDTNCNPQGVDFVIPGNDDAIRSIRLFASKIAEACIEGAAAFKGKEGARPAKGDDEKRDIGGKKVAVKKVRTRREEGDEAAPEGAETLTPTEE